MAVVHLLRELVAGDEEGVAVCDDDVVSAVGWEGARLVMVGGVAREERTCGVVDGLVLAHQCNGDLSRKAAHRPGILRDVEVVPYSTVGKAILLIVSAPSSIPSSGKLPTLPTVADIFAQSRFGCGRSGAG